MPLDPIVTKEIEALGLLTLEDLKEALKDKVSVDRAMEVSNMLQQIMIDRDVKPSEAVAGAVVLIMKVLAAPIAIERAAQNLANEQETPIQ